MKLQEKPMGQKKRWHQRERRTCSQYTGEQECTASRELEGKAFKGRSNQDCQFPLRGQASWRLESDFSYSPAIIVGGFLLLFLMLAQF